MILKNYRNIIISLFVFVWVSVFHYESLRHFYLQPYFQRALPKLKFLYPPAGWIMFYHVDDRAVYAKVYGVRNGNTVLIDPHEIIRTRFIGFDMVHRNVLSVALIPSVRQDFCRALKDQFPEYEKFIVTAVEYPSLTSSRFEQIQAPFYHCVE